MGEASSFYLVKVLIGRKALSLDRPFSYWTEKENIHQGMRVIVSFGSSKEAIGFVVEEPQRIEKPLSAYEKETGIKLSLILSVLDETSLLTPALMEVANWISSYYHCDKISVLSSMLPPSLKPSLTALKKPQAKDIEMVYAVPIKVSLSLNSNESALYSKVKLHPEGVKKNQIGAKKALASLLEKGALEVRKVPVYRIPEIVLAKASPIDLTKEQEQVYNEVLSTSDSVYLLQGVTGSGKTEVYLKLADSVLRQGKSVLILLPEIALTDSLLNRFVSHFDETVSLLNSSLSDARRYDEYRRILSGESKVVLGTRSAIFAPLSNLGLILIDEEHSSSYKQDKAPFYDAIEVAKKRAALEGAKVVLGSATPRLIDRARADKGVYHLLRMNRRYSANQEKDLIVVDTNDPKVFDLKVSSLLTLPLIEEIKKTLALHQQVMLLLNRRGYAPAYYCRNCHALARCPNCSIPLSYHKREGILACHHCGYRCSVSDYECASCHGHDFIALGFGTEHVFEELRFLFPQAKILRLDSDVSSKNVRHEVLSSFADGEADILIGTQVIAKGHDFPRVTLAAMLDADASLRLPTYMANEETFDLISQFVGRAGRKDLKGRVLLQTLVPENKVIQLASKQDYETFYRLEMEERRKFQYPPYTYLTSIQVKALSLQRCEEVANMVRSYLLQAIGEKRFNLYGPSVPYVAHINGRYYRNLLLKYKNQEEASQILDGLKPLALGNKDVEISINVDPGAESL